MSDLFPIQRSLLDHRPSCPTLPTCALRARGSVRVPVALVGEANNGAVELGNNIKLSWLVVYLPLVGYTWLPYSSRCGNEDLPPLDPRHAGFTAPVLSS